MHAACSDTQALNGWLQVRELTRGMEEHTGSSQGLREMLSQQVEEAQKLKVCSLLA